jgi:Zn-dependent peptidase ImmA (M78 family)
MTRSANKQLARDTARALLEQHAVRAAPVPVERIAKALGIRVEYAPLDDELSGLAYVRDGVPFVGVNTLHAPNRQRFTLAHELAHVRLHWPELEAAVCAAMAWPRQAWIRLKLRPTPLPPNC